MKAIKIFLSAALLLAVFSVFAGNRHAVNSSPGFAVVELFTSEGCSSCPPADAVVAKIEKESAGKPIYILAFHVDYWNRLGWKDIFSSTDYTARQQQYSRWLNLHEVYTPQAIVNGKTEMVGSEESKLRNAIKSNIDVAAPAQVSLSAVKIDNGKIDFQYQTKGNTANTVLTLAVVQKSAQNKIKAGENSGRTLSHVQIVRVLKIIKAKKSGSEVIEVPQGFNTQGDELIAFLQNTATGLITGATKAGL